ncbi:hypothetical protein [Flavobacterium sp.]|uniref:hypothetical protein n=1 Tax=Flavobacterium sp. TaxID=239 RepID=UPI002631C9EF|nr:hypothetical protein [Flavobacterium sp.]
MQIGNPSYKKCPHCGQQIAYYPGPYFIHHYEFTEWSDGETFEELPCLKNTYLQKCNLCNEFYWFTQKLGGMSFEDYVQAAEYFENKYSVKKSINFIYRLRNKKRLIYIRTNILRKYNDQIRIHPLSKGDKTKPSMSVEKKVLFENNAKILIELLTEIKSDDFFLLAELNRNIGNFEEAKRILNQIPSSYKKDLLFQEINKKNCEVITVTQTSPKRQSDLNFI